MDKFELKYFMVFVIIIELIMSYYLLTAVYDGYQKKRVKMKSLVLCFILMIVILLITLAIAVFI